MHSNSGVIIRPDQVHLVENNSDEEKERLNEIVIIDMVIIVILILNAQTMLYWVSHIWKIALRHT